MPNFLTSSLHISLSRTNVCVTKKTGWIRTRASIAADAHISENAALHPERLNELLLNILAQSNCTKMTATIVLCDDLVRFFMVTPPQNSARPEDIYAAAAIRFQSLYDESSTSWQLSADWDARYPFLACAAPRSMLTAIHGACAKHQLKVIQVTPQFVFEANRWSKSLKPQAWLGVVNSNTFTLGAMHQGQLCAVRSTQVPADRWEDYQWLPEHLKKEALRFNLSIPEEIQLCGNLPEQWLPQKFRQLSCTRLGNNDMAVKNLPIPSGIVVASDRKS